MSVAVAEVGVDNYVLKSWIDAAVVVDEKLHGVYTMSHSAFHVY